MKRDTLGRIILDDYELMDYNIIGRKEKQWLSKNNQKYLFKTNAINYEIYAEMIAAELAKQCGFETASYDLAIYQGKTGIVTPSFLNFGDIIINGENYLEGAKEIAAQNNIILDFKENSIENILNAVALQDPNSDIFSILKSLFQMFCFDLLILESDRNKTNWSMIRDINGNLRVAPIYDCSTMARLNTDVESLVKRIYSIDQIYNITDKINFSLKLTNNGSDNYFEEFSKLCEMYPKDVKDIIEQIKKLDIDKAFSDIETRVNKDLNDKNFEIPIWIKIWCNKAIGTRQKELINLYNNNLKSTNKL